MNLPLHGIYSNGTHDVFEDNIQFLYIYASVDNDTMKILKEIDFVNSHILKKYSEITNIS